MDENANTVAGWKPIEGPIAGYRDPATGQLDTTPVVDNVASVLRQLLGVAIGAAAVAFLYFGQDVLVPITLAIMLSFILSPLVHLLQRLRLWRVPAVVLTVLAALGIIVALGTLIGTQAASLSVNAPQYARAIEAKVQVLQGSAARRLESITKTLGGSQNLRRRPAATQRDEVLRSGTATDTRRPVLVEVAPPKTTPYGVAATVLEPVVGPLETMLIVIVVTMFVLIQREDLRDRFIRVFGSNDLHRTTMALDDAGERLSRYFLAQLAVNTGFGLIVGIGLWLIGVPSPAMWGVLAGMLRFVPYIGPVLAAAGPVALGAAIDPGWSTAIIILLAFVVVEGVMGYVLEPLLYGHSTGLSPVSVVVAAIFWTWLWGPIGLILSTPMTLCLVVLGRHVKVLEFFDVILGDRPALTPVESFYQRILADNPDEALAQAEAMLTTHSLLEYYDEVVVPALKLAAIDEARGTIGGARIARMTRAMMAVIDELDDHADRPPVAEPTDARADRVGLIACIAGRGAFDVAVAAMLSQLVERDGYTAIRIPHGAASREEIDRLDLSGVQTILLSYLELSGTPAHLRYLIRRLRQKAPEATIVVGLWAEGEPAVSDPAIQQVVSADRYLTSLRDAAAAMEVNLPDGVRHVAD